MDQPPQGQADLLHPLASLEWNECHETPVGVYNAQAVVLGNKVYVGGGRMYPGSSFKLLIYNFIEDLWDTLDTPTQWYSLTTYHSQLVLVGGADPDTWRATNELWVLDEQHHWTQPLPLMTTERYQASAVSVNDFLIVAGGCGGSHVSTLDTVEVYDGYQWTRAHTLPKACSWMKSTLHEGSWYLAGGMGQKNVVYQVSLESLIATTHSEGAGQTSVWKKLPDAPLEWSTPVVIRNQLITVGRGYPYSSALHTYLSSTNSWVHVGDLPVVCNCTCSLVLPTGQLLVVGGDTKSGLSSYSFRANIGVTSFLRGHFNMSALDRLEKVARIPIFNKLAPKYLDMASALCFHETVLDDLRNTNNPVEGSKAVMRTWLLGKSSLPSTWQVLLEKLQAIGMGKLAQGIEQFFTIKPVFSPLSLMSESKKDLELELSEVDNKERQTKPDCKDVAVQNSPDCREVAIQTHSGTTTVDFFGGVDVLGETEFTVPTQGDSFEWKGYGLKLHVSEGSLPEGMEECRIIIRMSLSGHFQLPEDSDLLSPVFWISPSCKFTKPVTLEIQHCAFREDEAVLSYLSFVSTKWSQRDLPYKFGTVDGGLFTTHSSYGIIQLHHFSGNAVTGRKRTPRSYCAHVYHTMKQMYDWRYYFVITQDLDATNTVVKEHYCHFARQEATLRIRFERSEITLCIPEDGLVTKEGWRITPFSFPTISRKDADQFKPGQWIPECQLIVQWCEEDRRPVQLRHKVSLDGAKAPYNFFYLTMNPAVEHWEEMVRQLSTSSGGSMEYNQSQTPDMKDLMDALYHMVAEKWECIGIYLHLPMPMLKAITAEHRHDPHRCLIGMLEVWLKRVDPPPTWSAIIEAVKFLGEEQLARELRKKYCMPLN